MKTADRISSLTLLGVAAYFLIESRKFSPFGALFPRVIIYILMILSASLFISTFLRKKAAPSEEDAEQVTRTPGFMTFVLIAAWAGLISYVGFFVTSVLLFAVITLYLDGGKAGIGTRIKRVAVTAAVVTGFYLFFAKVLIVPFPEGILF